MYDWLAARAAREPDSLALIDADTQTRLTYRDMDEAAANLAAGLRSVDIGPGTRVGTICPRGPDAIILVWATLRAGATLVPLDDSAPPEKLTDLVAAAEIDRLVIDGGDRARLDSVSRERLDTADPDRLDTDDRGRVGASIPDAVNRHVLEDLNDAGNGDDVTAMGPEATRFEDLDETRVLLFTSGTTGEPKAVGLTPRNLAGSAAGSAFRLGVEPADRWLLTLPLYHMGGLAIPLRSAMYGTAVVLEQEFEAERTAEHIEEYEVTGISLVPTMLKRLLDDGWQPDPLRFVLVGGAPTPEPLALRALEAGVPLFTTYGMTETASQIATATPAELRADPSTVGRPLRTVTVRILDDDGSPQETGKLGEIAVSGTVLSPGYLDSSWSKSDSGWFHTGDEGYLDADGKLYVTGRRSDLIITGGENVHPSEVEETFRRLEAVDDIAVVGLPDDEWGERVAALVVPSGDPSLGELQAAGQERLAAYAVPKTIGFADSIPRTRSGTVDRAAVRQLLSEHQS